MTADSTPVTQIYGHKPERSLGDSLKRGWSGKCPECGHGRLFSGYLMVNRQCPNCELELDSHRADDAPPYFTILIVAHVVVPGMIIYERMAMPPLWHQMVIGIGVTVAMSLLLLPRIKGMLIGLQWAKHMHGFGSSPDTVATPDGV
ncbi:MAG: DUF983 domain-containing protein [Proteobacteria bacterium]|jgi:uncharacterized protein (DUF983 family)|nr:DUF983 domain-containing protein [Pseudomonadota bacterium]